MPFRIVTVGAEVQPEPFVSKGILLTTPPIIGIVPAVGSVAHPPLKIAEVAPATYPIPGLVTVIELTI